MNDQRIIFFLFAGREENLRVQWPYLERLLRDYPLAEVHYWNLTRNEPDNKYVRSLHDPANRVYVINDLQTANDWPIGCRRKLKRPRRCGCKDCRPAPYEKVYQSYAERDDLADAVFVKLDDDVLFIETARFGEVLDVLAEHPDAVVSANVVNNVVSAKHDPELRQIVEDRFRPKTQREWFDLHAAPEFAQASHDWFLGKWRELTSERPTEVRRSMPGERVSINTIAFTYPTMVRLDATIRNPRFAKMGDEGAICNNFLPRMVVSFRTAHLNFGTQRIGLPDETWTEYRARYAEVAREYLA